MGLRIATVLLCVAAVGCTDPNYARNPTVTEGDSATTPSDGATTPSDTSGEQEEDPCAQVRGVEVGLLDEDWMRYPDYTAPVLSGGALFLHQEGLEGRLDVSKLIPGNQDSRQQITFDPQDDHLVDVQGGWVLVHRLISERFVGEMVALKLDEGLQPSEAIEISALGMLGSYRSTYGERIVPRRRLIEPNTATWEYGGEVALWSNGETRIIGERGSKVPDLDSGRVVWSWNDPDDDDPIGDVIMLWDGERRTQLTDLDEGRAEEPLVTETHVFWSVPLVGVKAYQLPNGPTRLIHDEEFCTPVDALGDKVALICIQGEEQNGEVVGFRSLWVGYAEGSRPRLVSEAPRIITARLDDRERVFWAEYDDRDETPCDGLGMGRLLIAGPGQDEEPVEVGPIGAPCWCCGGRWPPLVVEVEGDLVAWNYGLETNPADEQRRGAGVGWARFLTDCR